MKIADAAGVPDTLRSASLIALLLSSGTAVAGPVRAPKTALGLHVVPLTGIVLAGNESVAGLPFGVSGSVIVDGLYHAELGAQVVTGVLDAGVEAFGKAGANLLLADGRDNSGAGWVARVPVLLKLSAFGGSDDCYDGDCYASTSFLGLALEGGLELRRNGSFIMRILFSTGGTMLDYGEVSVDGSSNFSLGLDFGVGF